MFGNIFLLRTIVLIYSPSSGTLVAPLMPLSDWRMCERSPPPSTSTVVECSRGQDGIAPAPRCVSGALSVTPQIMQLQCASTQQTSHTAPSQAISPRDPRILLSRHYVTVLVPPSLRLDCMFAASRIRLHGTSSSALQARRSTWWRGRARKSDCR